MERNLSAKEEGTRTGGKGWVWRAVGRILGGSIAKCDAGDSGGGEYEGDDLIKQANKAAAKAQFGLPPPQFTDCFSEVKRLTNLDTYDGFRFDLQKPLTPTFFVQHSLWLGSSMLQKGSHYAFAATVVDVGDWLVQARVTKEGDVDGRLHFPVGSAVAKVTGNLGKQQDSIMSTVEYADDHSACTLSVAPKGPQVGFAFNQNISKAICYGMDVTYNGEQMAVPVLLGARYSGDEGNWCAGAFGTLGMLQLQYMRKVSPRVQLGAEFATNPFNAQESGISLGAEFRMKQSTYACSIDGTGKIDASLESRFLPMASLTLTGQLNVPQNSQRFGFGVQMQGS